MWILIQRKGVEVAKIRAYNVNNHMYTLIYKDFLTTKRTHCGMFTDMYSINT